MNQNTSIFWIRFEIYYWMDMLWFELNIGLHIAVTQASQSVLSKLVLDMFVSIPYQISQFWNKGAIMHIRGILL